MNKMKHLVLMTCLFMFGSYCVGQSRYEKSSGFNLGTPKPDQSMFNTSSLINVDHITGTLNVNIPIYELKERDITIPIVLSYHGIGIKVRQDPGWVGLGWNLSVGGSLEREVNGLLGNPTSQYESNIASQSPLDVTNGSVRVAQLVLDDGYAIEKFDTEPDVMHYNFPGQSGLFIESALKGFVTVPYNPQLKLLPANAYTGGYPYMLRDGGGVSYLFKTGENTKVEGFSYYKDSRSIPSKMDAVEAYDRVLSDNYSSYQLKEIVSANQINRVVFNYNNPIANKVKEFTNEQIWLHRPGQFALRGGGSGDFVFERSNEYKTSTPVLSKTKVTTSQITYLSDIQFEAGRVLFDVDTSLGQLKQITVQLKNDNSTYRNFKIIKFTYALSSHRRYFLEQVAFFNGDNARISHYSFSYNNDFTLPAFDSKSIDYWGYFNNENNKTLISLADCDLIQNSEILNDEFPVARKENLLFYTPQVLSTWSEQNINDGRDHGTLPKSTLYQTASRMANLSYAKTGALKSIQLATGGKVDVLYESNKFNGSIGSMKNVITGGGIRVMELKHFNSAGKFEFSKRFKYGTNEDGIGYGGRPLNLMTRKYVYGLGSSGRAEEEDYLIHSEVNNVQLYKGSAVAYKDVAEYMVDSTNNSNGKVTYEFTPPNPISAKDNELKSSYMIKKILRDDLSEGANVITYYSRNTSNGAYSKVKEIKNDYQLFGPANKEVTGIRYYLKTVRVGNFDNVGFQLNIMNSILEALRNNTPIDTNTPRDNRGWVDIIPIIYDEFAIMQFASESASLSPYYEDKYGYEAYSYVPNVRKLVSTTTIDYSLGAGTTGTIETKVKTMYDSIYVLPQSTTVYSSRNDTISTENIYSFNANQLSNPTLNVAEQNAVSQLVSRNIIAELQSTTKRNKLVVNTKRNTYGLWNGNMPQPATVFEDERGSRLEERVKYLQYDVAGNLLEYRVNDLTMSQIWDYSKQYPVAKIINAALIDVAYTSFEADGNGNWTVSGTTRINDQGITGNKCYNLGTGSITKSGLGASKKYLISYWSKSGAAVQVNNTVSTKEGETRNGWTYWEKEVSGTGNIIVSGNGYIDELRLYPIDAQMTTYTVIPSIGVTSECSPAAIITYYQYDKAGRLSTIKDQYNNVLKTICYNYAGQVEDCGIYYNAEMDLLFSRNNCAPGLIGKPIVYKVSAGKYTSLKSQAAADSIAIAAAQSDGQTYANQYGICVDPTITTYSLEVPATFANKSFSVKITRSGATDTYTHGTSQYVVSYTAPFSTGKRRMTLNAATSGTFKVFNDTSWESTWQIYPYTSGDLEAANFELEPGATVRIIFEPSTP